MKEKKLLFVLGHGRSGTTLLSKILTAHPEIHFFAYEFNGLAFFHSRSGLYNKKGRIHYDEMAKDLAGHPKLNFPIPKISAGNFGAMAEAVFDIIRNEKQKNIMGIKAANNILQNVDAIKTAFPNAYCVHIIRDPRDVYLSYRMGNFGAKSPFYIAKAWKEAVQKISTLKENVGHYHQLYYEDLLTQSEKKIHQLCDFLGVEFSENMLHFYKYIEEELPEYHALLKQSIVTDNFNKWQKDLSQDELDLIYCGAGDAMYEVGYCNKSPAMRLKFLTRVKEYCLDKAYFYLKLAIRFWTSRNRRYRMKISVLRTLWRLL